MTLGHVSVFPLVDLLCHGLLLSEPPVLCSKTVPATMGQTMSNFWWFLHRSPRTGHLIWDDIVETLWGTLLGLRFLFWTGLQTDWTTRSFQLHRLCTVSRRASFHEAGNVPILEEKVIRLMEPEQPQCLPVTPPAAFLLSLVGCVIKKWFFCMIHNYRHPELFWRLPPCLPPHPFLDILFPTLGTQDQEGSQLLPSHLGPWRTDSIICRGCSCFCSA